MNFTSGKLQVKHTADTNREDIIKYIGITGYKARIITKSDIINRKKQERPGWYTDKKLLLTIGSGVLFVLGLLLSQLKVEEILITPIYALSIIIGGYYIGKSGLNSLKTLSLDMNFLMSVAVIGAALIGEWSEGAAVVVLFSIGNTLQNYTMDKTRRSIEALMDLAPNEALLKLTNEEMLVAVDSLNIGDIIIVKPGAKIPMDGVITKGYSNINQAPITGESIPVEKTIGDDVFAGTINQQGLLEIKVTKLVEDTTLAKIMHMVEEAQGKKAPYQQLVDRFAKYYTPLVVLLAIIIAVVPPIFFRQEFILWFKKALVLLVIGCPCALVISTPVSIVSAIGNASRQGILIKGGAYLEETGLIKAIAFDKTGTLTEGKPRVIDIEIIDQKESINPLAIAAALEKASEHPLARAIVDKAIEEKLEYNYTIEGFEALLGKGIKGAIQGKTYYLGNPRLFQEEYISHPASIQEKIKNYQQTGKTVIIMGTQDEVIAIFTVADAIRKDSNQALKDLRKSGIDQLIMLTGDHQTTAQAVAQQVGIDSFKSELMPEDKLKAVEALEKEYGKVAMVGDGINDAPALASATIGIAMGVAGTDAALETADIALMGDDLTKLAYVIELSKNTVNIIKQNIWFSIVIKLIFMVLTFLGMANLWMAVFADTGAALIVILNGMRLLGKKH